MSEEERDGRFTMQSPIFCWFNFKLNSDLRLFLHLFPTISNPTGSHWALSLPALSFQFPVPLSLCCCLHSHSRSRSAQFVFWGRTLMESNEMTLIAEGHCSHACPSPAFPSLPSLFCSVHAEDHRDAYSLVSVSVAVPGCICICCSGCIWIWVVVVVRRRCLVDWLVTIQLMRLRAREFWIRIQARLLFQCWLANYRNFCMKLDYFKIVTNKLIAHYAQTATWHSPLFALFCFFLLWLLWLLLPSRWE